MSEIPTYPNECPHRLIESICGACQGERARRAEQCVIELQSCIQNLSDQLRTAKSRITELEAEARHILKVV